MSNYGILISTNRAEVGKCEWKGVHNAWFDVQMPCTPFSLHN